MPDKGVLVVLKYTLSSGLKGQRFIYPEQLKQWMTCYENRTPFVVTVAEEVYGLNPDLVAEWSVQGRFSPQREELQLISDKQQIEEHYTEDSEELTKAYEKALGWFRIECKCGSTYEIRLPEERTKAGCRECNEMVLADKISGLVSLENGLGYIMTNKRYVDRSYIDQIKR